jgi:hypothetical protein
VASERRPLQKIQTVLRQYGERIGDQAL